MHSLSIFSLIASVILIGLSPITAIAFSGGTFHGDRKVFPNTINPTGSRLFVFSPKYKAWGAYSPQGELVGYGRASGGSTWCKELGRPCTTPSGKFTIKRKGTADCKSGKYPLPNGGAAMPYCMFFLNAYAIHGSPHVPDYNASHGCIRVRTHAAQWLTNNFINIGTRVYVLPYN